MYDGVYNVNCTAVNNSLRGSEISDGHPDLHGGPGLLSGHVHQATHARSDYIVTSST